ncbi:mitochondrial carrier domain-containing protein [Lasiosphaeris hirsuta]|uniref:Mitochondrial carrier domain-containing protein n=1 Tax=Lasiosphaeris hirsuta TaxID=260670 RepID=A0AA40AP82_9PEZI|nr:mitochondrial carrier domain-containing protein [Lasiosphaeris hirsuta]
MSQAGAVAAFTVDLLVPPTAEKQLTRHALRGLYQGIGSVIVATLPAALPSVAPQPVIHALASASAELASCLVLTLAEMIKQNAQVFEGGPVRRLWAGFTALAARNLPFTAMHFPLFEFVHACIWERRERRNDNASPPIGSERMQGMHMGCCSFGRTGRIGYYPTDVVKTRMMLLSEGPKGHSISNRTAQGMRQETPGGFEVAKAIFREGGIRGLFRGAVLRTAWTALGGGPYLGSYEAAKFWLKGRSPQRENDL